MREGLVVEDPGGADLDEVAAELALERAVLLAAEVHLVAQAEDAEVVAAGVVVVQARAAVAGDAAVELVGDEGAEVLVAEGPLQAAVAPVRVPGHHRHVLQVTLAALVADGAVVRMAHHHELDHAGAEPDRLLVVDDDARALLRLGHAGHGDLAVLLAVAAGPELAHGALPASADRAHDGVPAEERQVEAQRERHVEHVAPRLHAELPAVDHDGHEVRPGVALPCAGAHRAAPWTWPVMP
jgi:hypothetical protein